MSVSRLLDRLQVMINTSDEDRDREIRQYPEKAREIQLVFDASKVAYEQALQFVNEEL